jgi:tRNA pseudouridine55 synthase
MVLKVVNIYKKVGQTPLDCIKNLKKSNPSLAFSKITYAGRLDPLAEGVLLLLIGDECFKKEKYLKLKKEYQLTILFGFSTDTYDLMGKITKFSKKEIKNLDLPLIEEILSNSLGLKNQNYPPYSSKTFKGKPLFFWARNNKIEEIKIPKHFVFIEKIKIIKRDKISKKQLIRKIKKDISLVEGDFRQKDIIINWEKKLNSLSQEEFLTLKIKINCGSGFYARVFAKDLGDKLKIPTLALKIVRTKVGNFTLSSQ